MKGALPVLIMCFAVLLFNSGARFSIGLMLHPMVDDLGWTRTTLSAVVTVFMIISACALPFTGQLVDRLGARRILIFGITASGIAVAMMGAITSPWHAFICYGLLFAFGSAATSITPIGVLLSHWYPQKLGMANSVAISGMGIGQLLIVAVLSAQLVHLGWRGAFVWLGVAIIVCVLPMVLIFTRDHRPPSVVSTHEKAATNSSMLRSALRNRSLWLLFVIYAICGFQDFLIATHIVALAVDEGVDLKVAGNMLAFMGLAGLFGVLLAGWINDRVGPVWPTALCFVIRIIIFVAIVFSRDPIIVICVGLVYGFTFWITAPLTVVFARRYFGIAVLGTISGLITMVHHASGGLGAVYAARAFDGTGDYQSALIVVLVLSVVGLVLTALLARPTSINDDTRSQESSSTI